MPPAGVPVVDGHTADESFISVRRAAARFIHSITTSGVDSRLLAIWGCANNRIYFRWCEYPEISHLPESVDFVMPLMVLMLRVDLFMTTIAPDPNAGKNAVVPVGLIFDLQ